MPQKNKKQARAKDIPTFEQLARDVNDQYQSFIAAQGEKQPLDRLPVPPSVMPFMRLDMQETARVLAWFLAQFAASFHSIFNDPPELPDEWSSFQPHQMAAMIGGDVIRNVATALLIDDRYLAGLVVEQLLAENERAGEPGGSGPELLAKVSEYLELFGIEIAYTVTSKDGEVLAVHNEELLAAEQQSEREGLHHVFRGPNVRRS